jgi:hypothetical protein
LHIKNEIYNQIFHTMEVLSLARKENKADILPMLKTVEQMSRVSGIGENKLRDLMDKGELEYVQNGNRRLIADSAIWDWYDRVKTTAAAKGE